MIMVLMNVIVPTAALWNSWARVSEEFDTAYVAA